MTWLNLHRDILEEFASFDGVGREYFDGVIIFERKRVLCGPPKTNAQRARESERRNRAKVCARARQAYARDPERHKARVKAWKAANRERVNEAARRRAARRRTAS